MDRFEHGGVGSRRVKITRRRYADTPRQSRSKIGENVGVEIGGNNGIHGFGVQDHTHGNGVHQHLFGLDVWVLLGYLVEDLVPEHHSVTHGVRLGAENEVLPWPGTRGLKRKAHDAFCPYTGIDGELGCHGVRRALVADTALAGVLPLTVLADEHPVQVTDLASFQRTLDSLQDAVRSSVDILIQLLADGQNKVP